MDAFKPNEILYQWLSQSSPNVGEQIAQVPYPLYAASNAGSLVSAYKALKILVNAGMLEKAQASTSMWDYSPTDQARAWLKSCCECPIEDLLQDKARQYYSLKRFLGIILAKLCKISCPQCFTGQGSEEKRSYDDLQRENRMIKLGLLDIYGQVAPRSHQLLQVMLQKYPGELIDYFVSECAWTRATCLTMLKAYDNVEHDPELKKLNFEKARADANAAMTATDSYFLQVANFLIPRIPKDNWAIILTQITKEPYYAYSAFGHYRQKLGAALKSLTL